MKVIITNAEEAEMPSDIKANCEQLLARRIANVYDFLPEAGDEIEILYSEKDPLGDTEDEEAYFIYFDIVTVKIPDDKNRDKATIMVEVMF